MTKKDIIKEIADIHNLIAAISVHGDDAIAMAQALISMRDLVKSLQTQNIEEDDSIEMKGG